METSDHLVSAARKHPKELMGQKYIKSMWNIYCVSKYRNPSGSNISNKKVLLRERKRHTARRVVNTPSVVLSGYPPWPDPGGYPVGGLPYLGTPLPDLAGGVTLPGYPPARVPPPAEPGRVPPPAGPGRVPPPAAPWHSGKCCKALWDMGTSPGVNRLKTLPSPSFGCGR